MKKLIPVLSDSKVIYQKLLETSTITSKQMICMYHSQLNSIITDPIFMAVSMEDKIIHRAFSVFDTTKVFNNKIFNIDSHIDRFLLSISQISLKSKYSKEELKEILFQTAVEARKIEPKIDIDLRFFYSAGLGNFSVIENPDFHTFYVLAIRAVTNESRPINGTKDFLVNKNEIIKVTSQAKTTSYLNNCIVNKYSKEKGGYLGIIIDEDKNLLESTISNVAFVNLDNEFVVPSFDKTLKGTTVTKCFSYIESDLIPEGLIKSISRKDTNFKDIEEGKIKEAMLVGGDFLSPLLEIEGITISKEPGVISRRLQEFLNKQKNEIAEDLPIY